ncbi:MAG: flavin reductase [Planctomycetes bacterium]|nr:flavin reductase [Planctomycetota bacterium]
MSDSPIDPILGRVPSGIYILTVRRSDQETGDQETGVQETGMLASWVMQAGFDPPSVTVAVKQGRYVGEWIAAGEKFVLNVLGENHKAMLGHFGRGFDLGEPAFDGIDIQRSESGVPVLSEAIGYLECEASGHVDSGDHRIFLARVINGRLSSEEKPMVHVRNSGAHY